MEDSKYQRLLQNQYKCIKADREQIQLTAKRLRDLHFTMFFFGRCKWSIIFYPIKDEYINYLKKYDAKVADNKKGKRPYVGVVLEIDGRWSRSWF